MDPVIDKGPYIQRIKELHLQKVGKELSDLEALNLFEKLVALVETIYKPIKKAHE